MSQKLDLVYRAHWGVAPGIPALVVSESKLVTCSGSRISAYNMDGNLSALLSHCPEVIMVHSIYLSPNTFNVVASVKLKGDDVDMKASVLIYDITSVFVSPSKPKVFQFPCASYINSKQSLGAQVSKEVFFTSLCFSADSTVVAGVLNIDCCGIVLFNPFTSTLQRVIPMEGLISTVSISPYNSAKFCVTGNDGIFQYWRLSARIVNAAPILNLPKKNPHYTSHIWINENRVVAGTSSGSLTIVHQCDHMHTVDNIFGSSSQDESAEGNEVHNKYIEHFSDCVNCLISKGDYIFAASSSLVISIYEIKHTSASGNLVQSAQLVPLIRYYLSDVLSVTRMDWKVVKQMQSYSVYLTGNGCIMQYDLRKFDFTNIIVGTDNYGRINVVKAECIELKAEKTIFTYHIGGINNIALSSRTSTLMSTSPEDAIIMAKDIQFNSGPSQVKDCFIDRKDEIPIFSALHPTGLFVATATENYIREYAVTDSKLEPSKIIPAKSHWHAGNGQAVSNSVSPSFVKYSNGGQFLAVVTGKIAQIFHMFNLDYNNSDMNGTPTRIMTAMDHTSVITDLAFSKDDSMFITTDISGCVYSWNVSNTTVRSGDFVMKGAISLKVDINSCALGKQPTIAVIYNSHIDPSTISRRNANRQKAKDVKKSNNSNSVALSKPDDSMSFPGGAGASVGGGGGGGSQSSSKNCIMFWNGALSIHPTVVNLEVPPTSIALGWSASMAQEICVVGLNDGRILLSALPMPLMYINVAAVAVPLASLPNFTTGGGVGLLDNDNASVGTSGGASSAANTLSSNNAANTQGSVQDTFAPATTQIEVLDESKVAKMSLHSGRVSCVCISPTGLWVFTSGIDGAVFMIALSSSAKNVLEIPEVANAMENNVIICEKSALQMLRAKVLEADTVIEDTKKDCDRIIFKMTESKNATVSELEGRMKRELMKRDEIIVRGRQDFTRMVKQLKEEINKMKDSNKAETAQLEYMYEKKLAQEAIYLDRMRQAYDEFVLHARHNLADANREYEKKLEKIEQTKMETVAEGEKQKKALLMYVDFMNNQHKLLYDSLEERQGDERAKLKEEISAVEKNKENSETQSRMKIVKLHTETHRLKDKVQLTEEESLKLQSDLDWARNRIDRLETSLQQSTTELKKKNDLCSTWEFKVGEMSQQVADLERVRKVLTIQLHSVREEMAPKEERLTQVADKLSTTENEYFLSLHAITDKEYQLREKSESLNLLKKQLGELRRQSLYKESLLKRLAKIFEDYKWALRQAQYSSVKKPMIVAVDPSNTSSSSIINAAYNLTANVESPLDGSNNTTMTISDQGNNSNTSSSNNVNPTNTISAGLTSAYLKPKKKEKEETVVMVEVISRTESMEKPLKELDSLLKKFLKEDGKYEEELLDDAELVRQEQERHHSSLQNGIQNLTHTLQNAEKVFDNKVFHHLRDNQKLLEEVNFLRHELRGMSMENQRLIASSEHVERQNKKLAAKLNQTNTIDAILGNRTKSSNNNNNFSNPIYNSTKDRKPSAVMKVPVDTLEQPSMMSLQSNSLGSKHSRQASPPDSPDPDKITYDGERNGVSPQSPDLIIDAIIHDVKNDAALVASDKIKTNKDNSTIYTDSIGPDSKSKQFNVADSTLSFGFGTTTAGGGGGGRPSTSGGTGSPSRLMQFRVSSPPRDKRQALSKSESQPLPVNKNAFEDFMSLPREAAGKTMSVADVKILALMAQNEADIIQRKHESEKKKIQMPVVMRGSLAEASEISGGSAAEILRQYQTVYTGGPRILTFDGQVDGNGGFTAASSTNASNALSKQRPSTSGGGLGGGGGALSTSKSAGTLKFEEKVSSSSKPNTSRKLAANNNNNNNNNNISLPPAGSSKR